MDSLERLFKHSQGAAQKLQVRSALNPLLWLCGIVTPICLIGAYTFGHNAFLQTLLVIGGLSPVFVACLVAVYFAIVKPEKLQSEEFQIKEQTLRIVQDKSVQLDLNATSLEAFVSGSVGELPEPLKQLQPPKEDIV